jgi:hypothetical protein
MYQLCWRNSDTPILGITKLKDPIFLSVEIASAWQDEYKNKNPNWEFWIEKI